MLTVFGQIVGLKYPVFGQKCLKYPVFGLKCLNLTRHLRVKTINITALDVIVFQGGDDGRGYRNMCKIAGWSKPNLRH
jgi:hypothetical protein